MKDFWDILEKNGLKKDIIGITDENIESAVNRLTEWKLLQVNKVPERKMVFSHELRVPWYIASAIDYLGIIDLRKSQKTARKDAALIILAGYIHGAAKYNWPEEMFTKDKKEFNEVEENERITHPQKAVDILKTFLPEKLYKMIEPIVLYHHERHSGQGYPEGKKGREIPFGARILAPFDCLDAGTTRVYHTNQKPKKVEQLLSEFRADLFSNKEKQYNPDVLRAVLAFFGDANNQQLIDRIHNYKFI